MNEPVHFMGVVEEWETAREALKRIERAEHPDLTDVFGRVWVWIGGDLYRHDSMTWTKSMVESPSLRGPSQDALASTNYTWCEQCKAIAS